MMKNIRWSWSLIGKYLMALVSLALIWCAYPVLAGLLGVLTGLCLIAYWGENTKSPAVNINSSLHDYRRRLALVEAGARNAVEGADMKVEKTDAADPYKTWHGQVRRPASHAAPSDEPDRIFEEFSLREIALASITILGIAIFSYAVHMPDPLTMLLFLSALLLIARHAAMLTNLVASGFATLLLSIVLPPMWSLRVARAEDQLALILFLLVSIVGCRMVRGETIRRVIGIWTNFSLRS
jgi:hypothetical protein